MNGWWSRLPSAATRRRVDRYFLTEYGQEQFGISGASWHQPGTLARLLERLTSVEWLPSGCRRHPGPGKAAGLPVGGQREL